MGSSFSRNRLFIGAAVLLLLLVGLGTAFALSTWGEVNRVTIDRPGGPSVPEVVASDTEEEVVREDSVSGQPTVEPNEDVDVFLLVGSDSREDLEDIRGFGDFGGRRADVLMVLFVTPSDAAVLSLPRDLLVEDFCHDTESRINQMLEGCGEDMNGATALTLSVESIIGETVDHFAMVDLAGFPRAVDAVGGYEICVQNPVRDSLANLQLPAGCTMASGEEALAWMRSRSTQELTDNGWRVMPGVNDLVRNERQREFLIEMMGRLGDFSSPQALAATAQAVAPFVTVDSQLSLVSAVNLAWTMRGLGTGALIQLEVPVYDHVTETGAAVLLPSEPIDQVVAGFLAPEMAGDGGSQLAG